MEVGSQARRLSFRLLSLIHHTLPMSSPTNSSTNVITHALEKMSSVSKKPTKLILKSIVLEQKDQIEAALSQGYTYQEIAHELERVTKEAYPDEPNKWVVIAPATLRKYLYYARKLHTTHTPSNRSAIANPFEQRL